MKRVFDFNRFVNYLRYDLNNLKTNYGLSLLLISSLPVIMYVLYLVMHVLMGGNWNTWVTTSIICSAIASFIALLFSMPKNLYGKLTEKKEGSAWILIPASTTEKWLSMLVVILVVIPVVFLLIYGLCTGVLALVDPVYRGVIASSGDALKGFLFNSPLGMTSFTAVAATWMDWAQNVMIMTLGAICFKKAKTTKTLLCVFAFFILLSLLSAIFFHTISFDQDDLAKLVENWTAEKAQLFINVLLNVLEGVTFAALAGGIFWRLRTIKH